MRAFLLALLLMLGPIAPGAWAQQDQITATINGQLDAFTHRDAAKAFSFASPMIKRIFGTADNFAAMVQNGYPMVWTPQAAEMMELRTVAGNLWQRVHITDVDGKGWVLDYEMVQTPDGWRINAVQLLQGTDLGA